MKPIRRLPTLFDKVNSNFAVLTLALAIIFAACIGQAPAPADTLVASKLQIKSKSGAVIIELGNNKEGGMLTMFDRFETPFLSAYNDGTGPVIHLLAGKGLPPSVTIRAGKETGGAVITLDKNSNDLWHSPFSKQ